MLRAWLLWTAGFLAFPLAGLAGTAVAGRVDDPVAAPLGGPSTGAGDRHRPGAWSARGRLPPAALDPGHRARHGRSASARCLAVGYRTSLADLALMGALTGAVLGIAQALALPRRARLRWLWAATMPVLWALGWTATTAGGLAVDDQFTVFGANGAVTFTALSGLLLQLLAALPPPPDAAPTPGHRRIGGTA